MCNIHSAGRSCEFLIAGGVELKRVPESLAFCPCGIKAKASETSAIMRTQNKYLTLGSQCVHLHDFQFVQQ